MYHLLSTHNFSSGLFSSNYNKEEALENSQAVHAGKSDNMLVSVNSHKIIHNSTHSFNSEDLSNSVYKSWSGLKITNYRFWVNPNSFFPIH